MHSSGLIGHKNKLEAGIDMTNLMKYILLSIIFNSLFPLLKKIILIITINANYQQTKKKMVIKSL